MVLKQMSMVLKQIAVVLRQISVALEQNFSVVETNFGGVEKFRWCSNISIAPIHPDEIQFAKCWCGNQTDDGVGAAMGGVEASFGGVATNFGGVETKLYGVVPHFGDVEARVDRVQAFCGCSGCLEVVRKPKR